MQKTIIEFEQTEYSAELCRAVETAAAEVLRLENAEGRYASVVLTDDETIHRYNRDYRGVDRATDVLSFPADEGDSLLAPPDGFLGDIMISVERAALQGEELGHSTARETAFLTVHGMLHLLGYDHMRPEDEEIMLAHQREVMASPGIEELFPSSASKV